MWWKLARLGSPSQWHADQVRRRDALIREEVREIERITSMAKQEMPKKLFKAATQAIRDNPEWLKWASSSDAKTLLAEVKSYCEGEAVQRWCGNFRMPEEADPGKPEFLGYVDSWTSYFPPRAELVNPLKEIFASHGCHCDLQVRWRSERLDLFVDRYHERSQRYAHARFVLRRGLLESGLA